MLYRVSKDVVTKRKTYQYVVPSVLREEVLRGVLDEAGHHNGNKPMGFFVSSFCPDVHLYTYLCTCVNKEFQSINQSKPRPETDALPL